MDVATLEPMVLHPDARPDVTVAVDLDDRGIDTPTLARAAVTIRGGIAEAVGTTTAMAEGLIFTRWDRADRRYQLVLDAAVGKLDFSPDRARSAWAALPVTLPGPSNVVSRITLHLPDNGKDFALEGDRILPATLAGARLKRTVTQSGATIEVEDRVEQFGGRWRQPSSPPRAPIWLRRATVN